MPEEYKIDYTGIQIPDIESIKRTSQQFTDWRRSMGFQTEEEKNAALKAEMQAAQQRFNDQDLWNSEDPYEVYNTYETDPTKQAEFRRNGQIVAGVGSTIATLPFTAGMMGWVPALATTATGTVGGYAGVYGGQKLGQHLDNKYGWNTTPYLSFFGGLGGGILGGGMGYKGTVKLGSRGLLPKGGQTMYGKQFITDVASDALNRNVRQITPALNYGTVKYYGPTMGKTTAAKTNPNLVDFDDYVRGDLDALASQLGMTRQQLMMSQDPTVRENARQLMLKSIEGWRQNPSSYGKTLVISKSDVLQDPIFDNQPLVLQRPEFLKRNAARGETDLQNSMDWYASTRRKGGNKLMEWPDPEGVYISELEPFTPDPHHITFAPQASKGSYVWFERPSKLTLAEKMGIPKGERNQPVKLGYRSEFPNDTVVNAEPLKNEMLDLFNSDVYRGRLIKAGYSDAQIDDFLKNRMQLGAVRKAPIAISSDVELGDAAHWYRNYVKMGPNTKDINEEVFHELGHGSDFPGLYQDPRQPKITKLAFPGSKYYLDPSEIRTRGLGVLQWMQKYGKTIDDFYKPGNTGLNKRAQEFWLYYPEDQGRQYLSSFWKQGGKIENPDQ